MAFNPSLPSEAGSERSAEPDPVCELVRIAEPVREWAGGVEVDSVCELVRIAEPTSEWAGGVKPDPSSGRGLDQLDSALRNDHSHAPGSCFSVI